jgi:hypothetical protein
MDCQSQKLSHFVNSYNADGTWIGGRADLSIQDVCIPHLFARKMGRNEVFAEVCPLLKQTLVDAVPQESVLWQ